MIALLKGKVVEKGTNYVVILTNGIGFLVHIPLSTYVSLAEAGDEVTLFTHTIFKDNAIEIYGFKSIEERELFKVLMTASGIGAKLGLTILSGLNPEELTQAILKGDSFKLRSIPGVGKKLADRIVFELKDKVGRVGGFKERAVIQGQERDLSQEAISALLNLGYTLEEAREAVLQVKEGTDRLEELIRNSLRFLAAKR